MCSFFKTGGRSVPHQDHDRLFGYPNLFYSQFLPAFHSNLKNVHLHSLPFFRLSDLIDILSKHRIRLSLTVIFSLSNVVSFIYCNKLISIFSLSCDGREASAVHPPCSYLVVSKEFPQRWLCTDTDL